MLLGICFFVSYHKSLWKEVFLVPNIHLLRVERSLDSPMIINVIPILLHDLTWINQWKHAQMAHPWWHNLAFLRLIVILITFPLSLPFWLFRLFLKLLLRFLLVDGWEIFNIFKKVLFLFYKVGRPVFRFHGFGFFWFFKRNCLLFEFFIFFKLLLSIPPLPFEIIVVHPENTSPVYLLMPLFEPNWGLGPFAEYIRYFYHQFLDVLRKLCIFPVLFAHGRFNFLDIDSWNCWNLLSFLCFCLFYFICIFPSLKFFSLCLVFIFE